MDGRESFAFDKTGPGFRAPATRGLQQRQRLALRSLPTQTMIAKSIPVGSPV